jgi:hypothetical protein
VYEKEALAQWVAAKASSPLTRAPVVAADLHESESVHTHVLEMHQKVAALSRDKELLEGLVNGALAGMLCCCCTVPPLTSFACCACVLCILHRVKCTISCRWQVAGGNRAWRKWRRTAVPLGPH